MIDFDFDDAPGGWISSSPSRPSVTSGEPPDYVQALNPRQREAVLITEGPLMVLAGAGSGKTKMLTSRISYLIDVKRVPAHQILAVTFTNKAAAEMRERVERTLQNSGALGHPEIGTFHAVCVRLLRRELSKTPFTKPFVIYDDSDQLSLLKGVTSKLGLDDKAFNPKSFQYAINGAKCDATEPQDMQPAAHNIFDKHLKRVYEQYQKDLFANNALDFGEIITMAYRILRDNPEVRAKYQRLFRYIHVDEYQDTNRSQYLLLSMLAGKPAGGHQNICVVGDEDQSIYKWRGADIRNILDFEKDYPGAQVVKLEQNYRSTKTIIAAAGHVIKNNKERKDKTLWTENEEGSPIVRAQLPDERAEAEMVVGEIKRLAESEDRSFKDFSIFYRTHAQSRSFEDVFRREKIPYQIVGGLRFYDRKEIKDILSYFKVVMNPSDSVGLKRIINVPARGIGKTTLDKLENLAIAMQTEGVTDSSYWAALQRAAKDPSVTSAGTAKKIAQFVTLIERLIAEQPKLTLSELYHLILDETAYVRELRQEGTDEAEARIENLEEFDTLLTEFEEDILEKVPDVERDAKKAELLPLFIEQSSLVSEADKTDPTASAIHMMTLHSSKGLEFPVVFLVGMEEGLFPSIKAWEEVSDEDIEEERRLCYVGMTRAREALYLSHVNIRRIWGNITYQEPARFFKEIPEEFMESKNFVQSASSFRAGSSRQFGFAKKQASYDEFSQLPAYEGGDIDVGSGEGALIGHQLNHPEYGRGTIIQADGSGMDQKVTIEFKGKDRRKFVFKYIRQYLA